MTLLEIFLVAVGLAMDAFGVAIGKGLMLTEGESYKKICAFFFIWPFSIYHAPHRMVCGITIY